MAVVRGAPKTRQYATNVKPVFKEFTRQPIVSQLYLGGKAVLSYDKKPKPDKIKFWYRPGTSDDSVLHEILTTHWYRRQRLGFDVLPREHWLDLGANIGGFALYCWLHHATCEGYEPQPESFGILKRNMKEMGMPNFSMTAVTHTTARSVPFYRGRSEGDYARYTTDKTIYSLDDTVLNVCIDELVRPAKKPWDGIKMDIEAAEHAILDAELLPPCRKLVLEYHIRKDPNMAHFRSRMKYLKSLFNVVHYAPSLDKGYPNDTYPGAFDRMIFCLDPK